MCTLFPPPTHTPLVHSGLVVKLCQCNVLSFYLANFRDVPFLDFIFILFFKIRSHTHTRFHVTYLLVFILTPLLCVPREDGVQAMGSKVTRVTMSTSTLLHFSMSRVLGFASWDSTENSNLSYRPADVCTVALKNKQTKTKKHK